VGRGYAGGVRSSSGNWRGGLAGLRQAYQGKWIEVTGLIAAGILRGRRPNGGEIERGTGISRRTVDRQREDRQRRIDGFLGGVIGRKAAGGEAGD
jgi:hypothetical protein